MPQDLPLACSLGAGDLEQRLAMIGEVGARSLVDRHKDGDEHLLHFRPDPETRAGLEAIVDAERECCAFLDLSLKEDENHLILSIAAPAAGQATADGFAMAFAAGAEFRLGSRSDPPPR
jgi:hypothetical protein